ncbi:MAG: hypothetical protein KGZ93_08475 [Actinobacteria bacterium]|nr:hypothetical protein [Actinomycetota bacterium]
MVRQRIERYNVEKDRYGREIMGTVDVLRSYFKNVVDETTYIDGTSEALGKLGFTADNSIACVGVCRDEISQPLVEAVRRNWGLTFNLSSLAAMFFAGKTGLTAAMHHAPNLDGRERYVFYSFPHIAIDDDGCIGVCVRDGRYGGSSACGALGIFQKMVAEGTVDETIYMDDPEISLIKARLTKEIPAGETPDLLRVTRIAQRATQADLEAALDALVDREKSDYAVITGIQVHGSDGNYIAPIEAYAYVDAIKHEIA